MVFFKPDYLLLLALVPVSLLVWVWTDGRRRADAARLGSPALIDSLSINLSRTRRRWKSALWLAALITLIAALARPRWGTEVQITSRLGVQVIVALDVSTSMLAEDVKPSRLARAKLTVEELMNRMHSGELGLVLFSGAAFVQFPLTADFTTARSFLKYASPRSISRPGTVLDEAIRVAVKGFPAEIARDRIILLLTDGEGHEGNPLAAAQAAANQGVSIYAIGFGSDVGEPIPIRDENGTLAGYKKDAQGNTVLSRLDETILQEMTNRTGGRYFRASVSGDEVNAVADAITALDSGERESQFKTQPAERFDWLVGASFLMLTAEFLIGDRVKRGS